MNENASISPCTLKGLLHFLTVQKIDILEQAEFNLKIQCRLVKNRTSTPLSPTVPLSGVEGLLVWFLILNTLT